MALTANQAREAAAKLAASDPSLGQAFTKPELVAAIQTTDAWIDTNRAALTAAYTQAFRQGTTGAQVRNVIAFVASKQWKPDEVAP